MTQDSSDLPGGIVFVEMIRLAVVVLATGIGLQFATAAALEGSSRLAVTALAAGLGYVVGGVFGRFTSGRVGHAERRLKAMSAAEILASSAGMVIGMLVAAGVAWPVLIFGGKAFTVPLAAIVVTSSAWVGLRVGRARAGDLLRFIGAGGRLPSSSRASGGGYKLVDTSALIDGRLVDICRGGWMEGVLVVPEFVLYELQGLADAEDPDRRRRGQRGLDSLSSLQRLSSIGVEVLHEDPASAEVDTALLRLARDRDMPLVTTDANLSRIAEVQGVGVRNVNHLAEGLRPPLLPGDDVTLRLAKPGREAGQGVGFLDDGTMVVVEHGGGHVGREVTAEVTGLMSNSNGRMVFATLNAGEGSQEDEGDAARRRPRLVDGNG